MFHNFVGDNLKCKMQSECNAEYIAVGIYQRTVCHFSHGIEICIPVTVETYCEIIGEKIHSIDTHHCISMVERIQIKSALIEECKLREATESGG